MELAMHKKHTVAAGHKGLGVGLLALGFALEGLLLAGAVTGGLAALCMSFPVVVMAGSLLALE